MTCACKEERPVKTLKKTSAMQEEGPGKKPNCDFGLLASKLRKSLVFKPPSL